MSGDGWLEPGEAGCRLLVRAGLARLKQAGEAWLEELAQLSSLAGLLVEPAADGVDRLRAIAARLETHGRACLLVDAVDLVGAAGAHGVHLSDWRATKAARTRLGEGWIIGASCDLSRHAAMVAGEEGADYVLFGGAGDGPEAVAAVVEFVAWWSELFYLPCAAAVGTDRGHARALVAAGADFLLAEWEADLAAEAFRARLAALAGLLEAHAGTGTE